MKRIFKREREELASVKIQLPSYEYVEWLESKIEEMQMEIEELNDDIDLLYGKNNEDEI